MCFQQAIEGHLQSRLILAKTRACSLGISYKMICMLRLLTLCVPIRSPQIQDVSFLDRFPNLYSKGNRKVQQSEGSQPMLYRMAIFDLSYLLVRRRLAR